MAGKRKKNPVLGYRRGRDGPALSHSGQVHSWHIQLSSGSQTLTTAVANWTHSEERDLESTRSTQGCWVSQQTLYPAGGFQVQAWEPERMVVPPLETRHTAEGVCWPGEAEEGFSLGRVRLSSGEI